MFRGEGVSFCLAKILDSSPFPNMFVTDGSIDARKQKSVSADATFIFYHSDPPNKKDYDENGIHGPEHEVVENYRSFSAWGESFVNCVAD